MREAVTSRFTESNKTEKLGKVVPAVDEKKLHLSIENSPEDRLNVLLQMTKLKVALEKAQTTKNQT